jgi:2-dehydropantoate 2-reductase
MTVQNGIPWWYFLKHGGTFEGTRLHSLDPDGLLASRIDVDRIIACVVYPAANLVAPGVIRHVEGNRFPIGEVDGTLTDRVQAIEALLVRAGLKTRILTDIRAEIWLKAVGTLAFNPISSLTHATMAEICQFPDTRHLATTMMTEAQTIAEKLGITLRLTIERRIQGAEAVGAHKTSMLQDVEAGRPLEIEALIGAVVEMGRLTQTPTPAIDIVYALTKLLDKRVRDEGRGIRLSNSHEPRRSHR